MRQLPNLVPTGSGLKSVVPSELASFGFGIPLHHADLSGYGLSTFSEWLQPESAGASITKVEFHVLNGRTAYEVRRKAIHWATDSVTPEFSAYPRSFQYRTPADVWPGLSLARLLQRTGKREYAQG
jgi:hypothetical protein